MAPGSTAVRPTVREHRHLLTYNYLFLTIHAWESRPFFSSSEGYLITKENSISVNSPLGAQEGERPRKS